MAEDVDRRVARHVVAPDEIAGAVRATRLFIVEIIDIAETQIGLKSSRAQSERSLKPASARSSLDPVGAGMLVEDWRSGLVS